MIGGENKANDNNNNNDDDDNMKTAIKLRKVKKG